MRTAFIIQALGWHQFFSKFSRHRELMWQRVLFLLVILASATGFYLWQTPQALERVKNGVNDVKSSVETVVPAAKPAVLYKWTNKSGQVTYGAEPPKGVKAQQVDDSKGSMSVVPATKVPAIPKPDEAQSDPRTIRQRAIERAVENG